MISVEKLDIDFIEFPSDGKQMKDAFGGLGAAIRNIARRSGRKKVELSDIQYRHFKVESAKWARIRIPDEEPIMEISEFQLCVRAKENKDYKTTCHNVRVERQVASDTNRSGSRKVFLDEEEIY